jgi:hypothetical protein
VRWLLFAFILVVAVSCARPADQPIEGWPTRSIYPGSVAAAHITSDLHRLGTTPGVFELYWTETELSSYLGSIIPIGDQAMLWCEPGEVFLSYHALAMNGHSLSVRMSPRLVDNQLQFELGGVWLDSQPLGSWFQSILQGMLNDILTDSLGQYRLNEFSVRSGQILIRGELG